MLFARSRLPGRDTLAGPRAVAGAMLIALLTMAGVQVAGAAGPTTVPLGTAASFAVLAGSGITNTGGSVVRGDIGTFPTATVTGFPPGIVTGTDHRGDAVTQGAKADLVGAYNAAAGKAPVTTIGTELGGSSLAAGTYAATSGTFGLTGNLTLNAAGDPSAVWVFQTASTLTTAAGSMVTLTGGAQSCNVFWQVGSSATLGAGTAFRGTILALTSISLVTGASVDGRLLARNGAVTLDTNTITPSSCAAAPTLTASPIPASSPSAPAAIVTPAPSSGGGATAAPSSAPAGTTRPVAALPSTSTADTGPGAPWLALLALLALPLLRGVSTSLRARVGAVIARRR